MLVCSYVCMSSFSSLLCALIAVVDCSLRCMVGLGAMCDEQLHRMFRQDRVKLRLPENDAEVRDFERSTITTCKNYDNSMRGKELC